MKVIQCWDDGIVDDVRLTDILRRYNAKATFSLNPGLNLEERSFGWIQERREVWRLSIGELRDVYDGFEICSHSMTHPCLTDVSAERLDWEVGASRDILEGIFKKPVLGFCYPFNAYNERVKAALRSVGYIWARGGHNGESIFPPRDPFEYNFICHFLSSDFWPRFIDAKGRNALFSFWGHSCEMTSEVMWHDLAAMIERISSDASAEWSFINDLFVKDSS
ncbi:MAG: polysaccharide deacetylase family protein [Syntrophales bacterium]|jgi:peptidoglycan-N-acetylglucosamine deacetylase